MSGFVDRENTIFDVLTTFVDSNAPFVVVGGYAVSAFKHRSSVDADVVIPENSKDEFRSILETRGFERVEDADLDVYGGQYLAYEKDAELPVTIDLLVNELQCRQTGASWSYNYLRDHAVRKRIDGSERSVTVHVPERELLTAIKLHSARQTDARDVVALAAEIEFDQVTSHLKRGDPQKRRQSLKQVKETIGTDDFRDSFKGVFSQKQFPDNRIETLQAYLSAASMVKC